MSEEQKAQYKESFENHMEKFRHEPFRSSLLHWMDTGSISGSFYLQVCELLSSWHTSGANSIDMANRIIRKQEVEKFESQLSQKDAEIERLKDELDSYQKGAQQWKDTADYYSAEIAELKAALKELMDNEHTNLKEDKHELLLSSDTIQEVREAMTAALSVGEIYFRTCVLSSSVNDRLTSALKKITFLQKNF